MLSSFPIGGSYNKHYEEESKIEVDVNSPLSEDENEDDEDDLKNIKHILKT